MLLLTLQGAPAAADTLTPPPAPSPEMVASAYPDPGTRALVRQARERLGITESGLYAYETTAEERMAIGARVFGRERTLFELQSAMRIDWSREGPVRVEILGGRTRELAGEASVPFFGQAPSAAFDPAEDRVLLSGINVDGGESTWAKHPLAEGSEAHYRFRSGDTLTIALPGGERVRVVELKVVPRRQEFELIAGSFWIDEQTHGVVRALYRPARAMRQSLGLSVRRKDGTTSIQLTTQEGGGGLEVSELALDLRYVTVEYALMQGHWMPRLQAVEGTAAVGSMATVPFRWERAYSDYEVTVAPAPEPSDTLPALAELTSCSGFSGCRCTISGCRLYDVELSADTAALLASAALPPSIADAEEITVTGGEIRALAEELRRIAPVPWALGRPSLRWEIGREVTRFNRVDGLATGAGVEVDFGALDADATLLVGTAGWDPALEVGVVREAERRLRLAGYHRLAAVNPAARPFGLGNSLSALLFGRDDGDYFRASGAELAVEPALAEPQWYRGRLFAERQGAVEKETDFNLPHLFGGDGFRPNIAADEANQVGAELTLRAAEGLDPLGWRWGAEIEALGELGTYRFARSALRLSAGAPLPGPLVGAVEVAGGSSAGEVPVQSLWYLGGPATLRGYGGNTLRGEAFWRARAEVGTAAPTVRGALFSDLGWAGERDRFIIDAPRWSVGVGVSGLDGIFRVDIARALRGPTGWRMDVYLNAAL